MRGRLITSPDETGHTFRARVGTAWVPAGRTPVLRRVSHRREVSRIAVVTAALDGGRARLYARYFAGKITTERLLTVLPYFRRKARRPLLIV